MNNNNNDLLILGIISIVALILLFRRNKTSIIKKPNGSKKQKKRVRINPIPVAEYRMNSQDKYYETEFTVPKVKKANIIVLLCYANWCEHCKEYKKVFTELIEQQPYQEVLFAMVEENESCKYQKYTKDLYGFPTVLIINNNDITHYNGERNKMSILAHIKNIIHY